MPKEPLVITLSDGQKVETLKRFRAIYDEELQKVEAELTNVLTAIAEAEFLGQYLGEQPEVNLLKARQPEADKLAKRRQHLSLIVDRLDQVIPKQGDVKMPVPGTGGAGTGARPAGGAGGGVRRY